MIELTTACYVRLWIMLLFATYFILNYRLCVAVAVVPVAEELSWVESWYKETPIIPNEFEGRKILRSLCSRIPGNENTVVITTVVLLVFVNVVEKIVDKMGNRKQKERRISCDGCGDQILPSEIFPCGHDCPHNLCKKCHLTPDDSESIPKTLSDYATAISCDKVDNNKGESIDLRNILSAMESLKSERDYYKSKAETIKTSPQKRSSNSSLTSSPVICAEKTCRDHLSSDQSAAWDKLLLRDSFVY